MAEGMAVMGKLMPKNLDSTRIDRSGFVCKKCWETFLFENKMSKSAMSNSYFMEFCPVGPNGSDFGRTFNKKVAVGCPYELEHMYAEEKA